MRTEVGFVRVKIAHLPKGGAFVNPPNKIVACSLGAFDFGENTPDSAITTTSIPVIEGIMILFFKVVATNSANSANQLPLPQNLHLSLQLNPTRGLRPLLHYFDQAEHIARRRVVRVHDATFRRQAAAARWEREP